MNETEVLLLSMSQKDLYFNQQWKSHRKDHLWTNMRLVGVEAGGAFSSVEVSQILVLRYISIFYIFLPQGPPSHNPPSVREPLRGSD